MEIEVTTNAFDEMFGTHRNSRGQPAGSVRLRFPVADTTEVVRVYHCVLSKSDQLARHRASSGLPVERLSRSVQAGRLILLTVRSNLKRAQTRTRDYGCAASVSPEATGRCPRHRGASAWTSGWDNSGELPRTSPTHLPPLRPFRTKSKAPPPDGWTVGRSSLPNVHGQIKSGPSAPLLRSRVVRKPPGS
jgi:hypothetical protein